MRLYLENTQHEKRAGGVARSVGPEFKLSAVQKKIDFQ
jgi:hypothetical protein